MFGFIKRNPFITILATAVGITAAFFPPVLLLTAFAGAGTIGAFVAATAITGVVATAVAFGALKAFSTFVEWLSPIMFPAAVIVRTEDDFEEIPRPNQREADQRPSQPGNINRDKTGSQSPSFFSQPPIAENPQEINPSSDKSVKQTVIKFSV